MGGNRDELWLFALLVPATWASPIYYFAFHAGIHHYVAQFYISVEDFPNCKPVQALNDLQWEIEFDLYG